MESSVTVNLKIHVCAYFLFYDHFIDKLSSFIKFRSGIANKFKGNYFLEKLPQDHLNNYGNFSMDLIFNSFFSHFINLFT